MRVEHIHEHKIEGRRLGRHVEHDPRSREFAAEATKALTSKLWVRHAPVFAQGDVGSCTGESAAGLAMTDGLWDGRRAWGQADALKVYELATGLDKIPGVYPPDDTGSSGLAAAKALKKMGVCRTYVHAFTQSAMLAGLSHHGPGMMGINWYSSFDSPLGGHAELVIAPDAYVRGGHELEVNEINVEGGFIRGPNSWGLAWGDLGYYTMSFATLARLLREGGDFTAPML